MDDCRGRKARASEDVLSVLDEHFGKKEDQLEAWARAAKKGTNYPEAEERIRALLDKWDEITEFHPHSKDKKVRTVLKSAARDFVNAIGERPDLLEAAITVMRRKGMVPATPRSAINFARELKQGFLWENVDSNSEAARRRYLKES